jgi:uncharacterized protein involved in cysteine biosynthesis
MIGQFAKAVRQLDDARLRRVVWLGIFLSLLVFIGLWSGLWWLMTALPLDAVPGVMWLQDMLGAAFDWLAGFLFAGMLLLLTLMLFPAVITVIVGFFLDQVADAVEERHYPALPAPRPVSVSETVMSSVRFALVTLAVNLVALPFYVLLLFVPPMNLVLFYLVNGYLISREYFEMVAQRRLDPEAAGRLRRSSRGRLQLAGMLLTLLMTIPFVNLLTPVLGTAFMVHVFHALNARRTM